MRGRIVLAFALLAACLIGAVASKRGLNEDLVADDDDEFVEAKQPVKQAPAGKKADANKKKSEPARSASTPTPAADSTLDDEEFVGGRTKKAKKPKTKKPAAAAAAAASATATTVTPSPYSPKPRPIPNRLAPLLSLVGLSSAPAADEPHKPSSSSSSSATSARLFGLLPAVFFTDLLCAVLLVVFVVVYILGKTVNKRMALSWLRQLRKTFETHFLLVGILGPTNVRVMLSKESAHEYKFYASGRRNCQSCLVTLHLRRRQDLAHVLFGLVSPSADRMVMDVALPAGKAPPATVAFFPPASRDRFRDENADIRSLTHRITWKGSKAYEAWSDLSEGGFVGLMGSEFLSFLSGVKGLEHLHLTDRFGGHRHPHFLRLAVNLEVISERDLALLVEGALRLVDRYAQLERNHPDRAACVAARAKMDEEKERDGRAKKASESIQKRREEKEKELLDRKKEIAKVAKEDPEEAQKMLIALKKEEEKERAKELHKRQHNKIRIMKS